MKTKTISTLLAVISFIPTIASAQIVYEVDFDASALPAGIHIVSLYVDGQLADTCRLIKQ